VVEVRVSGICWTECGDIYCDIATTDGHAGFLRTCPDGRITEYGEEANVEFGSPTLEWCPMIIGAVVPVLEAWLGKQQVANPALRHLSI